MSAAENKVTARRLVEEPPPHMTGSHRPGRRWPARGSAFSTSPTAGWSTTALSPASPICAGTCWRC